MPTLLSIAPEFAAEVENALRAAGRDDLGSQIQSAEIDRCTYEQPIDAGYVYFVRPAPSAHFAKLAAPVAQTISFYDDRGLVVDVDHDGHLYGIELLNRSDVIAQLQHAHAL